jgi:hypothetical protein
LWEIIWYRLLAVYPVPTTHAAAFTQILTLPPRHILLSPENKTESLTLRRPNRTSCQPALRSRPISTPIKKFTRTHRNCLTSPQAPISSRLNTTARLPVHPFVSSARIGDVAFPGKSRNGGCFLLYVGRVDNRCVDGWDGMCLMLKE